MKYDRPFQFRLSDLLLLMLPYGALCGFVLPHFYAQHDSVDPGLPYPSLGISKVCLPAVVLICGSVCFFLGVALVLWISRRFKWPRVLGGCVAVIVGLTIGTTAPAAALFNFTNARSRSAVDACKSYCTAQDIYRRTDYDKDGVLEYSPTFNGPFGLCAPTIALLDHTFENAAWGEGHPAIPRSGYVFKILKGQGPETSGGQRSYITFDTSNRPHMKLGYALIACPAVYGGNTVYTYLVNNTGTICEKDLGTKTPEIFKNMTEFNVNIAYHDPND